MATAVSAAALTRSSKAGLSRLLVGAHPPVPHGPGSALLDSALPGDPASIPVHAADETPALVEEQPHGTQDPFETEADTMADRAASQEPPAAPAPNHRR